MKDLGTLHGCYAHVDALLDDERSKAQGNPDVIRRAEERQRLNDQAYFVLCWGQLEAMIDDACRAAIRKRHDNPDWSKRRGWDLYNPDDRRLSGLTVEERASLVLDRRAGKPSAWSLLMNYYNLRNRIAHGQLLAERIEIATVIGDFYKIQSELAR